MKPNLSNKLAEQDQTFLLRHFSDGQTPAYALAFRSIYEAAPAFSAGALPRCEFSCGSKPVDHSNVAVLDEEVYLLRLVRF
ncbi:hypothetical protein [Terriglobus roseus]|uniref:hypothetical protein n=1 Tax=Terriglobus roseus TaxID=392734 RepID=UPI0012F64A41|nr:hypothetical protein [Terriglobus roseus]